MEVESEWFIEWFNFACFVMLDNCEDELIQADRLNKLIKKVKNIYLK